MAAVNPFFKGAVQKGWIPPPKAAKPAAPANPFFAQAAGKPWNASIVAAQAPSVAPVAPVAQTPAAAAPAQAPASQAPLPLDATALQNINTNQFNVNNKVNSLNQGISNLRTNLQTALGQLAYQQPRDELKTEQAANSRGALYSSVYNQNLGDLIHAYATKQTGLTSSEGQNEGADQAQIDALNQGIPLYNQGQTTASIQRAIAAAAANPATGQAPIPLPAAAPASAPAASRTIQDGGFGGPAKSKTIQDGGFKAAPPKATGFKAAPNSKGAIAVATKLLGKKK